VDAPYALLLDFGGTLDVPRHWLDRFLEHYRAAGILLDRECLDAAYSHATALGYRNTSSLRHYALAETVEYLVNHQLDWLAEFGPEAILKSRLAGESRRRELARSISARFVAESLETVVDTRALLELLHDRYRIGIVSNFYGNLPVVLEQCGFEQFIDVVVDSSAAGVFKPDAGIFMIALRELGVAARDAAMVGDSLDKDLAPARRLGMRTVWLRTVAQTQSIDDDADDPELPADYVIDAIAQLRDLIW
jgi:putative hydrolase of the HAD superfamily